MEGQKSCSAVLSVTQILQIYSELFIKECGDFAPRTGCSFESGNSRAVTVGNASTGITSHTDTLKVGRKIAKQSLSHSICSKTIHDQSVVLR